ncbi:ice-binding family protein [Streptomyces sp. LN549]|uniref:ice-binding family protein n=1 Tax=Streptomyces sp. LN549 TaxID=3112979 RepID=UPI0037177AF3
MVLNIPDAPHRRTMTAWIAGVLTLLVAVAVVAVTPTRATAATLVPLGTAESFAVLAGSTVTNDGFSVVTGDVGVHPGSDVTGFPPGLVAGGTIHEADGVAMQAKADLVTAYDNAFGQPTQFNLSAAPVNPTLVQGTYAVTSGLGLNGTWTLDAQNNPDAVWVFKIPAGLTTASSSSVVLQNGAQACNVFWVTDESATLGTDSNFVGTLMALTSITVTNGTTIQGRALARNGAVTLDDNVITRPMCDDTTTTTTGDAATGDAATGDAATGDAATGDAATGDAATGDAATGDAATGDAATGDAATGDAATGDAATGDAATGDAATGDAATGDAATGDAATGDAATGDAATGDAATGDATGGHEECGCYGKHDKPGKHGKHDKPGKHSKHDKHDKPVKHGKHGKHDKPVKHGKHEKHDKPVKHGKHGKHGKPVKHGKHEQKSKLAHYDH